uniref:Uncharacterized protein n=1 Tax=Plectus sambesii TaxID=2011161 RepID=A0A914V4U8_9BILA
MIPRQNFAELFRQTEGEFQSSSNNDPLRNVLLAPLKKVIDAAQSFGGCVKQCFNEKNAGGVCLEQFRCQPLLPTAARAKAMFKYCSSGLDFKKEGTEMCTCAVNAGV